MKHWQKALAARIHEVAYESLVREQEPTTRALVDFCNLEWDERCLSFHQNSRPVSTASLWQVLQPLYTKSVERWRGYESHLDGLRLALGEVEG